MVALDLTEMDQSILSYLDKFAHRFKPESIHFVHVVTRFDLPLNFVLKDEQEVIILDERVREAMRNTVREAFPTYVDFDSNFHVINGKPEREILKLVESKKADLIVLGRKVKLQGTGVVPNRLMRHAHASTLLIPESATPIFEDIFIPTDFSNASAESAVLAKGLLDDSPAAKLSLFYSCSLPTNYFPIAAADASYKSAVETHARKHMARFANHCEIDNYRMLINPVAVRGNADAIANGVRESNPDLIVLGEEKHSDISVFFLGSVTEKVIQLINDVPLLVVRAKGENKPFSIADENFDEEIVNELEGPYVK